MLHKKLIPVGDSTGIIIDKAVLQLLELSQGDEVKLDVVDGALVLSRRDSRLNSRKKFDRLAKIRAQMHASHATVPPSRKLAK